MASGEGSAGSAPSDSRRSSSDAVPATPRAAVVEVIVPPTDRPADLPDFRLLAKIGQGGFGSVWIAQHRHTGDAVAIKFIPPNNRDIELQGLQHLRQRVREGQDHLVWTEYIGESDGFIYCVMDLADPVVEGPLFADRYEALTLLKHLKQKGRLDVLEAAAVTLAIAKGLSFLQRAGLRHGDIKPANILRVRGKWKLADYGMMGGLDVRARGGTRSYLPPEGAHGDRADQYALGIVLHELVFGHRPSDSTRETWPESRISTGLRRIQQRLTDPDPNRRYASASELVKELEALASTTSTTAAGAAAGACPSCGEPIFGSEEACGGCGGELWRQCPVCQHRGSIVQRYCTQCRGPVHGIFAMRKELNEADSLLCDGHHRDALQRIEGPLQDLLLEVARDLSKLQGSDLSRRRRVDAIEEEFKSRLARMRERCRLLEDVDGRIAHAHERGDVTSLRDSIARALEIAPGASTYEALRADLPALEARSRWTSLLSRLGNPHQSPASLGAESLQIAIGTLRQHLPEHPAVRQEATRVLVALQDERRRRVRDRCTTAAAWHRREGRDLEALRWLRRAEARRAADREMLSQIAELSASLAEVAASIRGQAAARLKQAGGHRSLRRLESDLAAIEGGDSPMVKKLRGEWPRRRRIDLLRRISERAIARIGEGDFLGTDPLLALAFRIADRDPAVRDRVIDLDNSIAARIRTARALLEAADIAEAGGRAEDAFEILEKARSIAPDWDEVRVRLARVGAAASAAPVRRRRRRVATVAAIVALAAAGAIVAHHAWRLAPIADLVSRLESPSRITAAEARLQAASLLRDSSRSNEFLLTDLGLNEALRTGWTRSWERDHGAASSMSHEAALSAADELAAWRGVDPTPDAPAPSDAADWIDAAAKRLIAGSTLAATTRAGRIVGWRRGLELSARSGGGVAAFLEVFEAPIGADLRDGSTTAPTGAVLAEWVALAETLGRYPETDALAARVLASLEGWCDQSVETIRSRLDHVAREALSRGPWRVDADSAAELLEPWDACGERRAEAVAAFGAMLDQLGWEAISLSLGDGAPPRIDEHRLQEAGAGDRLVLIPFMVTTSSGDELVLAADSLMSVETATLLLGSEPDRQWRGRWVPSIDEAEALCRRIPRFTYLGTIWEPAIPSFARWISLRDLCRRGDPAQSDAVAAMTFDESFEEWLTRDETAPRSINPSDSSAREAAADGVGTTGLRLFFVASPPEGGRVRSVRNDEATGRRAARDDLSMEQTP
jgi:hypothetical protein